MPIGIPVTAVSQVLSLPKPFVLVTNLLVCN